MKIKLIKYIDQKFYDLKKWAFPFWMRLQETQSLPETKSHFFESLRYKKFRPLKMFYCLLIKVRFEEKQRRLPSQTRARPKRKRKCKLGLLIGKPGKPKSIGRRRLGRFEFEHAKAHRNRRLFASHVNRKCRSKHRTSFV